MGRELEPPEFGFKPNSRRNSKRFAPETFYAQFFNTIPIPKRGKFNVRRIGGKYDG